MDFEVNGIDDALPERADVCSSNLWFERLSYDCIVGWKGRHNIKGCCVQAVGQFRLLKNLARRLLFGWHYSNKEGWTENNP